MTPKRIAYVLHIFPKLSETFIAGELAELRRRGIALRILSLRPPREELQHEMIGRAGLVDITTYDVARFPEVIREFKPQLLHAHFATEATAKARELSKECDLPFTFTAHGYDIHRKPPGDFRERALAARAVVTVSDANANYIAKTFDVPAEHLRVIPCGVDTERFCPAQGMEALARSVAAGQGNRESTACRDDDEPLWIVCVARHVKVKNLGLLLEACGLLRGQGVKFRCAMIGDGPEHECLKAKRARLGLEAIVEMPGALEQGEVLKWWQRAAAGVLTSENEGMPVCLMEAAACGVPAVAPAVGGIPELVRDGETGLLTKPGDLRSFVNTLERLLRDPALRAQLGAAARRHAEKRFSLARQVDSLLELWGKVVAEPKRFCTPIPLTVFTSGTEGSARGAFSTGRLGTSLGAPVDKDLPTLGAALAFETARHEFKRRLPRLSGEGKLRLKAIRLTRHKPGRRAVVEYDVEVKRPEMPQHRVTLIGKLRARRSGNEGYRQLEMFWNAGFDAQSADGISVPEPVGVISAFQMWFQRKVSGVTAEGLFSRNNNRDNIALARRVAEVIHKVQRSHVPTEKQHKMVDELRILRECFDKVVTLNPEWTGRLAKLMVACEGLGASLPVLTPCGSHRDFYPAQVIVDGSRLWLIDFDLYCLGDPGLDAGNFIGHITEQALRERGDATALADVERALEERFLELVGENARAPMLAYTNLTLARHIFLSTRFAERAPLTEKLIALCEERMLH